MTEFDISVIESIIATLPEEANRKLDDFMVQLIEYREIAGDMHPLLAGWMAVFIGHQIIAVLKDYSLATRAARKMVLDIVAWAFYLKDFHPSWENGPKP